MNNPVALEIASFNLPEPIPLPDDDADRKPPVFEVEDVDELTSSLAMPMSPGVLDYNTSEAIPNTVYYRSTGQEGKARPSLEALRLGKPKLNEQEHIPEQPIAEEAADVDGEYVGMTVQKKWWQFWKKGGSKKDKTPPKLGWVMGVLVRCLLNIWGVMLFIRLTWVVGQAGIGLTCVIILLSCFVTVITTLSMSAICTNGEVKGGGAYYLISRSLGPEFGGAIGIIFSLANAVAVALYVVGFAETVTELLFRYDATIPGVNEINTIRIIGLGTLLLLLGVALMGLDWESKIQIVLLFILIIALLDAFIGVFIPRDCENDVTLQGFTGFSGTTFVNNIGPDFREGEHFFTVFAVFFPAATGILAGANISGDLKDPQTAIPKGTMLAIAITSTVYLLVAIGTGFVVVRDAPGPPNEYFNNSLSTMFNFTTGMFNFTCGLGGQVEAGVLQYCSMGMYNFSDVPAYCPLNDSLSSTCKNVSCEYGNATHDDFMAICMANPGTCGFGLLNYFQVMERISLFGPIVSAGVFAATLSSALASLVSAPKIFQRVCQDRIFPLIHFFAKGGGRSGTEPIRGYFLTFVVALACVAIGELNEIALIISNFFLMAYTLINFSCFTASFSKSPGWRPSFKYYSKWVALLGSGVCLVIMFVISWWAALITLVAVGTLYKIVDWTKPDINWGSSTQAFLYTYSMRNLLKLEKLEQHVKNFRPQFLILSGAPSSRPDLIYFFSHMAREVGIMICGQIILGDYTANRRILLSSQQRKWLREKRIKAFYNVVSANTLREGAQSLLQLSGLGKLRPNTLVIGYKNNWTTSSQSDIDEYVNLIHDAFDLHFGVVIFRLRAGFDATDCQPNTTETEPSNSKDSSEAYQKRNGSPLGSQDQPLLPYSSSPSLERYGGELTEIPLDVENPPSLTQLTSKGSYKLVHGLERDLDEKLTQDSYTQALEFGNLEDQTEPPQSLVEEGNEGENTTPSLPGITTMPSRFEKKQEKGSIDVWWLYDDGGLAILLPYLLSRHQHWKSCRFRIFTAGSPHSIDKPKLRMTSLLRKFRINFSDVIEVPEINSRPSKDSIDRYLALPLDDGIDGSHLDQKTLKHIRLGELLHQHSSDARLIVITISVPQRGVSSRQYMSWLESLSYDLPPILMMRGNQTSVLTFYS